MSPSYILCMAVAVIAASLATTATAQYTVAFSGQQQFTSFDGTVLWWNAYLPQLVPPSKKGAGMVTPAFPLVVCPNSWGETQNEYRHRLTQIVARGYIAVEYETRGFHESTGNIDTAGPLDRRDGSTLLSFLLNASANDVFSKAGVRANDTSIAFLGISYGAGISLQMAGYDKRVKTAVSMSGWNSLVDFAYGFQSPNTLMATALMADAHINGKPSAALDQLLSDLTNHRNIPSLLAWGADRSPQDLFLNEYIERGVPLFIGNNYLDRLFRPQFMAGMIDKLIKGWSSSNSSDKSKFKTSEERARAAASWRSKLYFMMSQGAHAQLGSDGLHHPHEPSYIWSQAEQWLDWHLRGIHTAMVDGSKVQMQYGGDIKGPYIHFSTWPPPAEEMSYDTWYLRPRGPASSPSSPSSARASGDSSTDVRKASVAAVEKQQSMRQRFSSNPGSSETKSQGTVASKYDGLFGEMSRQASSVGSVTDTIGFDTAQSVLKVDPLMDKMRSEGVPYGKWLQRSDRSSSIIFVSDPFTTGRTLCGIPKINLKVAPSGYNTTGWQVYAFLFSVEPPSPSTASTSASAKSTTQHVNEEVAKKVAKLSPSMAKKYAAMTATEQKSTDAAFRAVPGIPDIAELISSAAFTNFAQNATAPPPQPVQQTTGWVMHPLCQAIPAGWSVGVGFTLYDWMFTAANTAADQTLTFMYDNDVTIELPFTKLKPSPKK